jgi:hypothetical protein
MGASFRFCSTPQGRLIINAADGWRQSFVEASAAPHLPAGILSPYRDGERGAIIDDFANQLRRRIGA